MSGASLSPVLQEAMNRFRRCLGRTAAVGPFRLEGLDYLAEVRSLGFIRGNVLEVRPVDTGRGTRERLVVVRMDGLAHRDMNGQKLIGRALRTATPADLVQKDAVGLLWVACPLPADQ